MGRVIAGKYEELELLGTGSQGVVYKVQHVEFKTILALKTFPSFLLDNTELRTRFEQEARVLTRLRHPNIVRVVGSGRDEELGFHFIVMEYAQGKTLAQLIRERGALPLPEVLEISRQVASALDYAHRQNPPIVHRDIKPSNIMIEHPSGRPVVLDFGIAKRVGENEVTQANAMLGTWKYSPPEQLRHEPLTGSADVYALGMVMYEMYTGTQFFAGFSEPVVLAKVLSDTSEHQPYFSRPTMPSFETLVTKAIAKSRAKRYRSMAELINDLEACWWALDETKTVMLTSLPPPPSTQPPQHDITKLEKLEDQLRQAASAQQLLTSLKTQVQEARERAEQHKARQWAADLFSRALAYEDEASACIQKQQYVQAQEAYKEALSLFSQASLVAEAQMLTQQTARLRQEVESVQADAERYNAAVHAPAQYQRALTLLAQAENLAAEKAYGHAVSVYEETRSLLEDARDLAYRETLREEAEAVQTQAHEAKKRAHEEEAETLAVTLFREGLANEQQAATAFAQQEFPGARQFYDAARQKYEQARRQARSEQRQQAAAVAAEVQAVQQSLRLTSGQETHPSYRQAVETHRQAETHMAAHEYRAAKQSFLRARAQYEEWRHDLERVQQRQEMDRARAVAEEAQAAAEKADVQVYAAQEWQSALTAMQDARRQEAQEEWQKTTALYKQAAQLFARGEAAGRKKKAQENADAARRQIQEEKAKDATLYAWAKKWWAEAQTKEEEAVRAYQSGDYEQAVRLYLVAAQAYLRARETAEQERDTEARLLQQTTEARAEALTSRRTAESEGVQDRAATLYQRALALLTAAEQQWEQAAYQQARQGYAEVHRLFAEAREAAHRQLRQEYAEVAQTKAQAAREAAVRVQAETLASPAFQKAQATEEQARQAFQANEFTQAQQLYETANQHYEQAQQLAQEVEQERQARERAAREEKLRQRVQGMREQAIQAHHDAEQAETMQYAHRLYVQALQKLQEGETSFEARDWQGAESTFTQVRELFVQAQHRARQERERQKVKAVRESARAAYDEACEYRAAKLFPQRFDEAATLLLEAERAMQREDLNSAQHHFERCTHLFQQLSHDAAQQVEEEEPTQIFARVSAPPSPSSPSALDQTHTTSEPPAPPLPQDGLKPTPVNRQEAADVQAQRLFEEAPTQVLIRTSGTPPPSPPPAFDPTHTGSEAVAQSLWQTEYKPAPVHPQETPGGQLRSPQPAGQKKAQSLKETKPFASSKKYLWGGVAGLALLSLLAFLFFRPSEPPLEETSTIAAPPVSPNASDNLQEKKPEERQPPPPQSSPPEDSMPPRSRSVEEESWGEPPPVAVPPPQPVVKLFVTEAPPANSTLTMKEGEAKLFSVTVKDPVPAPVRYAWFVDEKPVAGAISNRFTYRAGFDEGGNEAVKEIRVRVSCCSDQTHEQSWQVRIENVNQRPKITRATPKTTTVTVSPDVTQEFSVKAEDPDRGDELTYLWLLNGEEVARENLPQFRTSFAEGRHSVEVQVSDSHRAESRQQWTVTVRVPEPARSRGELSQQEAQRWFDNYRNCWESLRAGRRAECLVTTGIMSRQRATDIENYLQRRREFRVSLQDVEIRPAGTRAFISFRRIDTIDGGAFPPARVILEIEKQSDGRIVINKEE